MNGPQLTRRQWFAALTVIAMPKTVMAAPGFHVTGPLTATDTERAEGYFQLGREIMIAFRPGTEPHRIATEMLNREVQFSLFRVS